MQALSLVWAVGSYAARGRAEIPRPEQPDPGKGGPGLPRETLDDPVQHKVYRPRFRNSERY